MESSVSNGSVTREPLVDPKGEHEEGRGAERRLHLNAFDYWQGLKQDDLLPRFRQLTVDGLKPFKEYSLLVERGPDQEGGPSVTVRFFGGDLAPLFNDRPTVGDSLFDFAGSGFADELLTLLQDPSNLSRAAEFEFVDMDMDSRGVMLPLSHDGDRVDFLWMVISFKTYETDVSQDYMAPTALEAASDRSQGHVDLKQGFAVAEQAAQKLKISEKPGFEPLYGLLAQALSLYESGQKAPDALDAMINDAGLVRQARAPFAPILKLIFGPDYDKTRLTEYGTAIQYALRSGIHSGGLVQFLATEPGGIKGCVKRERAVRRSEKGHKAQTRLEDAKSRLRDRQAVVKTELAIQDDFTLLLARRGDDGRAEILGVAPAGERTMSHAIQTLSRGGKAAGKKK